MNKSVIIIIIAAGAFILVHNLAVVINSAISHRASSQEASMSGSMILTSPSFQNNELIPAKFTCGDGDINPELHVQNVPEGAKSLALIMDDPDAPSGTFTHWLIWNINPETSVIKEESVPPGSLEGTTSFGRIGYGGPCPPPGKPHRYFFKLYALDAMLNLQAGASKSDLEAEIGRHLVGQTELVGIYERQ